MKQKLNYVPFVLALLLIIALYSSLNHPQSDNQNNISSHELILISQNKLNLSKFKGNSYVIHLFASWCSVCKDDFIHLQKISKETNVSIIGIAINDRIDRLRLINKEKWPYNYIATDMDMKLKKLLHSNMIPETIIVSQEGNIILRHIGGLDEKLINNKIIPIIQNQKNISQPDQKFSPALK
jgi:cytochrome c biogenesis protein CcmG/thiol:disulfide interchange protein DsbE